MKGSLLVEYHSQLTTRQVISSRLDKYPGAAVCVAIRLDSLFVDPKGVSP